MTVGTRVTNCSLNAPGYGKLDLICTELAYGLSIVSSESEARNMKAFYPRIRTSGTWYVNLKFADAMQRSFCNNFLMYYMAVISNPATANPAPMTVSVPSKKFEKIGYPVSSLDFAEQIGDVVWDFKLKFMSASEPELDGTKASAYVPPLASAAARFFYPAGTQLSATATSDHIITAPTSFSNAINGIEAK